MTIELTGTQPDPVRRHVLPGLHNLRDVGGYPAQSGVTRWGRLFRSDALHGIDEAGRARLGELGIAHVVDLRGAEERRRQPSSLAGVPLQIHELPVFDEAAPPAQLAQGIDLAAIYDHIVDHRASVLADAIRVIARAGDGEAVLVHCTAGKDRTGLVIAFALLAAGVDRDAVVADYALTARYLAGAWADAMLASLRRGGVELSAAMVELVTASPAPVLEQLLERVDREHGSPVALLQRHGLTFGEIDRLTAALVS
ncbi:tyrosine-protein phosphatase [Microbacterium sp. NPDC096154]|uniref:tyrosine-protein phosphatase n=1 Tax=Microbacterium sp. NPDC096154 TaxID=3155549 RepID=UPI0033192A90